MARRDIHYLRGLLRELRFSHEAEWLEFKVDNAKPALIGEYISALANSAALVGKAHGYVVWGVEDETRALVGTRFSPRTAKKGNEPLQTWLSRLLSPPVDFQFHELLLDDKRFVFLQVDCATHRPIAFHGTEFLRVGSAKRKLRDFPEKERALWQTFSHIRFEEGTAAERLGGDDVLLALNCPAYFDLLGQPAPDGRDATLEALAREKLIAPSEAGGFDVTNLGAMLLAKDLGDFPRLRRKALRIIEYRGTGRLETLREHEGAKGYAAGFAELMDYIHARLPTHEENGRAFQRSMPEFPPLAVRELVVNALIHQDFATTGTGPMVEIFEGRVEITNPGEPLVQTERFLDSQPVSRNEALASLMRRFDICEERGSGIDKVVAEVERFQLPAPTFEVPPGFTRAILFGRKPLAEMDRLERVRACYLQGNAPSDGAGDRRRGRCVRRCDFERNECESLRRARQHDSAFRGARREPDLGVDATAAGRRSSEPIRVCQGRFLHSPRGRARSARTQGGSRRAVDGHRRGSEAPRPRTGP